MDTRFYQKTENLIKALTIEKEYELEQFTLAMKNEKISDRIKSGVTIYPIQFNDIQFSNFGDSLLNISINDKHNYDLLTVGSIVECFDQNNNQIRGTVYKKNNTDFLILANINVDYNWLTNGKIGLNLLPDTKTYDLFLSRLEAIKNEKSYNYLNTIFESQNVQNANRYHFDRLNESQNIAVNDILNEDKKISIIHGPPGTGKTKTLVEAIVDICKNKKRVLVCAPTNTAVDNITKSILLHNIEVCRVGNPAKVDDQILASTLDQKAKSDKDFKLVERLLKEENEIKKEAFKYKRQFGKQEFDNRKKLKQELKAIRQQIKKLQKDIYKYIVNESPVVSGTFAGILNENYIQSNFDFIIVDEAAQAIEPAIWSVAHLANKLVLAGDHKQLPPFVKSQKALELGLDKTMIDTATENNYPINLLNTQYRMNHLIMQFSNQYFYKNKLMADDSVKNHKIDNDTFLPIEFIDTAGCDYHETQNELNFGISNQNEVRLIEMRLKELNQPANNTAIISPYKNQVNLLMAALPNKDISINTIDSFQGQEKEIVLISLVRSNTKGEIGFLTDYRRINVAMTRAQKKLIIIGDSSTIGTDSFFNQLLDYIEKYGSYRSAWEYMN